MVWQLHRSQWLNQGLVGLAGINRYTGFTERSSESTAGQFNWPVSWARMTMEKHQLSCPWAKYYPFSRTGGWVNFLPHAASRGHCVVSGVYFLSQALRIWHMACCEELYKGLQKKSGEPRGRGMHLGKCLPEVKVEFVRWVFVKKRKKKCRLSRLDCKIPSVSNIFLMTVNMQQIQTHLTFHSIWPTFIIII